MKYAWLSDLHYDHVSEKNRKRFIEHLLSLDVDGFFITGDVTTALKLESLLLRFSEVLQKPIYFVLGNHDFWGCNTYMEDFCKKVSKLSDQDDNLQYLTNTGPIILNDSNVLLGVDGFYDARLGNPEDSHVFMNCFSFIPDFSCKSKDLILKSLRELGDKYAKKLMWQYDYVKFDLEGKDLIILTHVPPFKSVCRHRGKVSSDYYLPFYSCKAMGDAIKEIASDVDGKVTVLCGHTHGEAHMEYDNLIVHAAESEYGNPTVKKILKLRNN